MRLYRNAIKLGSLEKGFDSIQIRIEYGGPLAGNRLMIFTNKNGEWKAEIVKITVIDNPNFKGDDIERANADYFTAYLLTKESQLKIPKSGWKKFILKLFELNILALPDENTIVNVRPGLFNDGLDVSVEIGTRNVYRFYKYNNPDYLFKDFQEAKDISQILKLVDEEFGLKQLWDYTYEMSFVIDTISKELIKANEILLKDIE